MSKLDDILTSNHSVSVFGESFDEEQAKAELKALFLELVLSVARGTAEGMTTHELAELSGRKAAVIEICELLRAL